MPFVRKFRKFTKRTQKPLVKLQRQVGQLRKASRANEHKINVSTSAQALATAGTVNYVSVIAQGDDINTRNGNEISVRELVMRLHFINGAAATNAFTCRVLLVQDSMNPGALPSTTDIIDSANVWSPITINQALQKRFKILREKIFTVGATGSDNNRVDFKWHVKGRELSAVNYINTTAAVGSAGKGSIFLLSIISAVADAGIATISFGTNITFDP